MEIKKLLAALADDERELQGKDQTVAKIKAAVDGKYSANALALAAAVAKAQSIMAVMKHAANAAGTLPADELRARLDFVAEELAGCMAQFATLSCHAMNIEATTVTAAAEEIMRIATEGAAGIAGLMFDESTPGVGHA
jgi:hypothetical protein